MDAGQFWVSALVVLVFVIIGGVFAAAEIALVSLREGQITKLSKRGRRGRALAALVENPNDYLAAGQVGVTVAGFLSAGFGAAQIAPLVAPVFTNLGLSASWADTLSFVLVTLVIAYVSLVLGELAPKRLGMQRAESFALVIARPMLVFSKLVRPFIWLLGVSTNAVVRILGGDPNKRGEEITGEELRDMVAAHEDLTMEERELIDDVFDAGHRELREIMVPRPDVDFLEARLTVAEAMEQLLTGPHSRYPVIDGNPDVVVGFVHVRDLLLLRGAAESMTVGQLRREILTFPGTKQLLSSLTEMRRLSAHLAIVADEYGGTAGIVTMEDLVEELVGDIQDEYDVPELSPNGVLAVDARLNLSDFAEETGIELPDGPYETAAGFMLAELGKLPAVGDAVDVGRHTLTVVEVDGRRIASISLTERDIPEPETES